MQANYVKDFMKSITEYNTISSEATLGEAAMVILRSLDAGAQSPHGHRILLVKDAEGQIIGQISMKDVIMGIEEGYAEIKDLSTVSHSGVDPQFILAIGKQFGLWQKPLARLCDRAAGVRVKRIMHEPKKMEFIEADKTLDEAVHLLVVAPHQQLLVTRQGRVEGVLRLLDVFQFICNQMQDQCDREPR